MLVSWKLVARGVAELGHGREAAFAGDRAPCLIDGRAAAHTAERRLFLAETIEPHHLGAARRLVGRVSNRGDRIGRNRQGFVADIACGLGLLAVSAGCDLGT